MCMLVHSDGSSHIKEVKYLKRLGLKMGLREEAVQAVLLRLTSYPVEVLEPEEVIQIFQTFHN